MEKVQFKLGGMSCSFCVTTIAKALTRVDGVQQVHVSLAHEETLIEYDPARVAPNLFKETLEDVGFTVRDPDKVRSFEEEEEEMRRERDRLFIAGALTWIMLVLMLLMWLGRMFPYTVSVSLVLALLTVFGVGWPILKMAWASLRRRIFNQHVLLEFAAFAGLVGGLLGLYYPQFPAADFFGVAVFVTSYHILSQYTSLHVRTRSSQAVRKLLNLQPTVALVMRNGREEEVPIAEIQPGDLVRVRPGAQVPVDGEVVDGASAVNESLVTGEPLPKEKIKGDQVTGGSVNETGMLVVRTARVGQDSFLQQVARHIQEARALKPNIIQLVDQVLKYFVPGVLAFAAGALLIWTLGAWLFTGEPDIIRGIFAALAVLVMGYPCALGMATPLAMIRGGGEAALRGILMRSGEAFQVFKDVKKVILDKTGTITLGRPDVADVISVSGVSPERVLELAASAEKPSEHPLARAIVKNAQGRGLSLSEPTEFQAIPGLGIIAEISGTRVFVGSVRFLESKGVDVSAGRERASALEAEAKTVVGVAESQRLIGFVTIADVIKKDANDAIARMKDGGLSPVMLTGDNEQTARAVALAVGISEVHAQVLPQDKAAKVRELQQQGFRVAMVGDGINDAPALMQSDVGVAIGAGTDIAIESSDVILIGERLGGIVDAYEIGRRSFRKTVQNLILAFSFNGIGVPLATTGLVHPVWAMIAMAASVTTVLANSFGGRLLPRPRLKKETREVANTDGLVERVELQVSTIHCDGCVQIIRDALSQFPEIEGVEGEPSRKHITVVVHGSLGRDQIVNEISRLGHTVEEA